MNSIYQATEGEGLHIGTPQVFIRLQGCNIGCVNCDSKDTWDFDSKLEISNTDILHLLEKYKTKRVSITGGDPTHVRFENSLIDLIGSLKKRGYFINMEASGTRIAHKLFDLLDFISIDFKTPGTGVKVSTDIIEIMQTQYFHKFQVKSVVETKEDFDFVLHSRNLLKDADFPWILTPCYNNDEDFPAKRFKDILEWNYQTGSHFRIIGQQHKWIFGADQKNV